MNDFDRIAAVIRHLDAQHDSQPSLEKLAKVAGLSVSHFHRLFRRWAGVTPKDFLQALTVEHAKQRLRDSASVLEAAYDAGLSGPGRLHDLFVTLEAASPGEFKSGGAGLLIQGGTALSPFGFCNVGWTTRGICHLSFHDQDLTDESWKDSILETWPKAALEREDPGAARWMKKIFVSDISQIGPLNLLVRATDFQLKVWRALLRIPVGSVASYGTVAGMVGNPGASRAVGSACGANAISYLIPCHRVVRETGVVQNYRWGAVRKRAMLLHESVPKDLV